MRLAGVAAACLASAALAACGGNDEGQVVEGTGYEVTVPDGWDDSSDQGDDFEVEGFTADLLLTGDREDGFTTNVNVVRIPGVSAGLDEQARAEREALEKGQIPGSDERRPARGLTPVERTEVAGADARAYEFELPRGDGTAKLRQVFAKRDGALYTITLTALAEQFEEGRAAFESTIDSWRWR